MIHDTLLYVCDPVCESCVEDGVNGYCHRCVVLGALETELVVPSETGTCNGKCAVAENQPRVSQGMDLLELQ